MSITYLFGTSFVETGWYTGFIQGSGSSLPSHYRNSMDDDRAPDFKLKMDPDHIYSARRDQIYAFTDYKAFVADYGQEVIGSEVSLISTSALGFTDQIYAYGGIFNNDPGETTYNTWAAYARRDSGQLEKAIIFQLESYFGGDWEKKQGDEEDRRTDTDRTPDGVDSVYTYEGGLISNGMFQLGGSGYGLTDPILENVLLDSIGKYFREQELTDKVNNLAGAYGAADAGWDPYTNAVASFHSGSIVNSMGKFQKLFGKNGNGRKSLQNDVKEELVEKAGATKNAGAVSLISETDASDGDGKRITLAIRGTDKDIGKDMEAGHPAGQARFYMQMKPIIDQLYAYIEERNNNSNQADNVTEILINGHSLGAMGVDLFTIYDSARFAALGDGSGGLIDLQIMAVASPGVDIGTITRLDKYFTIDDNTARDENIAEIVDGKLVLTPPEYYHGIANEKDIVFNPDTTPELINYNKGNFVQDVSDGNKSEAKFRAELQFQEWSLNFAAEANADNAQFTSATQTLITPYLDPADLQRSGVSSSGFLATHNGSVYSAYLEVLGGSYNEIARLTSEFSDLGVIDVNNIEMALVIGLAGESPTTDYDGIAGSNTIRDYYGATHKNDITYNDFYSTQLHGGHELAQSLRDTNQKTILMLGMNGNDTLIGTEWSMLGDGYRIPSVRDIIDGGEGNDTITGNSGDDILIGGRGNDDLDGGDGKDVLSGGEGHDLLKGGNDDDILDGGAGDDFLEGGLGKDILRGGGGFDRLYGQFGDDTFVIGPDDGEITIHDFADGDFVEFLGENISVGFTLKTIPGTDTKYYVINYGNTVVHLPTLIVDENNNNGLKSHQNSLDINFEFTDLRDLGTPGDDKIRGTENPDLIDGKAGDDFIEGLGGGDQISGGADDDYIDAGSGDDFVQTSGSDDGSGDDDIYGREGNDQIFGLSGRDRLFGGLDNDILAGGLDDDHLRGGEGADVFIFEYDNSGNSNVDIISDYSIEDTIEIFAPSGFRFSASDITTGEFVNAIGETVSGLIIKVHDDQNLLKVANATAVKVLLNGELHHLRTFHETNGYHRFDDVPFGVSDGIDGVGNGDLQTVASHNESINFGSGDDTLHVRLDGGSPHGTDSVSGGEGNDTLHFDLQALANLDQFDLDLGTGAVNYIQRDYSYTGFENFILNFAWDIDIFGTDAANEMTFSTDRGEVFGGGGNDTIISGGNPSELLIYAGDGDDYISTLYGREFVYAGKGDDTIVTQSGTGSFGNTGRQKTFLYGEQGNDNYVNYSDLGDVDYYYQMYEGEGSNNDIIENLNPGDRVHIVNVNHRAADHNKAYTTVDGDDLVIHFGADNSLRLVGYANINPTDHATFIMPSQIEIDFTPVTPVARNVDLGADSQIEITQFSGTSSDSNGIRTWTDLSALGNAWKETDAGGASLVQRVAPSQFELLPANSGSDVMLSLIRAGGAAPAMVEQITLEALDPEFDYTLTVEAMRGQLTSGNHQLTLELIAGDGKISKTFAVSSKDHATPNRFEIKLDGGDFARFAGEPVTLALRAENEFTSIYVKSAVLSKVQETDIHEATDYVDTMGDVHGVNLDDLYNMGDNVLSIQSVAGSQLFSVVEGGDLITYDLMARAPEQEFVEPDVSLHNRAQVANYAGGFYDHFGLHAYYHEIDTATLAAGDTVRLGVNWLADVTWKDGSVSRRDFSTTIEIQGKDDPLTFDVDATSFHYETTAPTVEEGLSLTELFGALDFDHNQSAFVDPSSITITDNSSLDLGYVVRAVNDYNQDGVLGDWGLVIDPDLLGNLGLGLTARFEVTYDIHSMLVNADGGLVGNTFADPHFQTRTITIDIEGTSNTAPVFQDAYTIDATITQGQTAFVEMRLTDLDIISLDPHQIDQTDGLRGRETGDSPIGVEFSDGYWAVDYRWSSGSDYDYLGLGEQAEVTFDFEVLDTQDNSSGERTATITVLGANDAPEIGDHLIEYETDTETVVENVVGATDIDTNDSVTFVLTSTFPENVGSAFTLDETTGEWSLDPTGVFPGLKSGEKKNFTFTFHAEDDSGATDGSHKSTEQTITVIVEGTNTPADISGVIAGDVTEDVGAPPQVSGLLQVNDSDAGEAFLKPMQDVDGTNGHGTFTVSANGHWTYTLTNDAEAVQSLGVGDHLTDSILVETIDGTTQSVIVTINGTNDVAVFDEATNEFPLTGNVTEDDGSAPQASGALKISDKDAGQAFVQPLDNADGMNGYGKFTVSNTGEWTYTLSNNAVDFLVADEERTDFVEVLSFDGTAVETITVTITGVNDTATITGDLTGEAIEDSSESSVITGQLTIVDPDQDQDQVVAKTGDAGQATYGRFEVQTDGSWTYHLDNTLAEVQALPNFDPANSVTLTDTIDVVSKDGTGNQTITVTIYGQNDAPVAIDSGTLMLEDGTISDTLLPFVTDVDSTSFTFAVSGDLPNGATLTPEGIYTFNTTGKYDYLAQGQSETVVINYIVSDGDLNSEVAKFEIKIAGQNDLASIGGDLFREITEDATPVTVGGQLTVADLDDGEDHVREKLDFKSAYGTFDVSSDGSWTYRLDNENPDVNALEQGNSLSDVVTVFSMDGTAAKQLTVTILGQDDAPTVVDVNSTIDEEGTLQGQLSGADAEGDTLTFEISGNAPTGLVLQPNGNWSYTAAGNHDHLAAGASEYVTFEFVAKDEGGLTSEAGTVSILVTGVNDVATISGGNTGLAVEDSDVRSIITGQLTIEDLDQDQDEVVEITGEAGQSTYGRFEVDADGGWTYYLDNDNAAVQALSDFDPADIVTLTDSIDVASLDGTGHQTITVTIHGQDDLAEIAGDLAGEVTEDDIVPPQNVPKVSGTLQILDADDGDTLVRSIWDTDGVNGFGKFTVAVTGEWIYRLDNDAVAVQSLGIGDELIDSIEVMSHDGSTTKIITVTIKGANDAATITGENVGQVFEDVDGQMVVEGQLTIADPDQNQAGVVAKTGDAGQATYGRFEIDADGSWKYYLDNSHPDVQALPSAYLPDAEFLTDTIEVESTDGTGHQTITVTIYGKNDAATISGDVAGDVTEDVGSAQTVTGTLDIVDPDNGEELLYTIEQFTVGGTGGIGPTSPVHYGTFSIDAQSGIWTYVLDNSNSAVQNLAPNEVLYDKYFVQSKDGSANREVVITIHGTNDDPVVSVPSSAQVNEYADDGTIVATASAQDKDNDSSIKFRLLDDADGRFAIDEDSGVIVVLDGLRLDHEQNSSHTLSIEAMDEHGAAHVESLTIDIGNVEPETINGDDRDNTFEGGNGRDTFNGGGGNDDLKGDRGNDRLNGDEGDDLLEGGQGRDRLDGGEGTDTASYAGSEGGVNVWLGGWWSGSSGFGWGADASGDRLTSIENVIGSDFDDRLYGSSDDNVIAGGKGNDRSTGGRGSDTFVFATGDGQDTITDFEIANDNPRWWWTGSSSDDKLQLDIEGIDGWEEALGFADQVGRHVVFDFDNGDTLTLRNTQLSNLDADNFL